MSKLIQIYGLPRSGTAFISTMLNFNPRCIAYHELYEKTPNSKRTINLMLKAYDYVADCNTHGWLMKDYQVAYKRICIRRDTHSSLRATAVKLDRFIPETPFVQCAVKLDLWAIESGAMIVYYEHLFKLETLGMIWDHCFDGNDPFPVYKVSELLQLNVQMNSSASQVSQKSIFTGIKQGPKYIGGVTLTPISSNS